jgi:GH15 family glucan-1,4-alpha-glucosidase
MALRIEDYALIRDTQTAALVGRNGAIDWLCVPRFDSSACFAALLGEPRHGRWKLAPEARPLAVERRYRSGTLVLETKLDTQDGFLRRYATEASDDGLPPGEGAFLPCSFWLVDALTLTGQRDRAVELFERLAGLVNDVGLLSEEYDPHARRLVGSFPQAFSHIALVDSALLLSRDAACAPAHERAETT